MFFGMITREKKGYDRTLRIFKIIKIKYKSKSFYTEDVKEVVYKLDNSIYYTDKLVDNVKKLAGALADSTDKERVDGYLTFYFNKDPHMSRQKSILSIRQVCECLKKKNAKVLEIGSGIGTNCLLMKAITNADVYGAEPCPGSYAKLANCIKSFKEANPHLPYTALRCGGESLPFKNDEIDYIYSFEVMEHVQNPKKVFEEIYRVLKPNGIAYIATCNYDSFYEGHYKRFWNPFIGVEGNRKRFVKKGLSPQFLTELNFITKRQIKQWVNEIGYTEIVFEPKKINVGWEGSIKSVFPKGFEMPRTPSTKSVWLHRKIESPRIARFLAKFDREYKLYFILRK